jgi:hypothetical protein
LTGSDCVDGAGLEISEDGSGDMDFTFCLAKVCADVSCSTTLFDFAVRVKAVLLGDEFPELLTDLVAALADLEMNYLAHFIIGLDRD